MPLFLSVKKIADGPRNVTILVRGGFKMDEEHVPLFGLEDLDPIPHKGLKLESMTWLIEDKMSLRLWWGDQEYFIAPLESRNYIRLDKGIESPERDKWDGIVYLDALNVHKGNDVNPKYFMLIIDLDKL